MSRLILENISFKTSNGETIVKDISFDVKRGETVALLGPSGSGKTSTLRLIAGLENPYGGTISIDGKVISNKMTTLPPEQRKLGMVFQDFALFPHLTVLENVLFGLKDASKHKKYAKDLLHQLNLSEFVDHYPHMLSGGQQQRVALARALAPKPKVLLMDEPFSGLDGPLRRQVRNDMHKLLHAEDVTAVFVTHDAPEAGIMSDNLVIMNKGTIIQTGTMEDVNKAPANGFVFNLLGEVNKIPCKAISGKVESPFGTLPTTKENGNVVVSFRPQAVQVAAKQKNTIETQIIDKHSMDGYVTLLKVKLPYVDTLINISTMVRDLPERGEKLSIFLAKKDLFVFAA